MSTTKVINSVPVITSHDSDDNYVLMQAHGQVRQMKAATLFDHSRVVKRETAVTEGWVTVAVCESLHPCGIIMISDNIWKGAPKGFIFSVAENYPNKPVVKSLGGNASTLAPKVRIVKREASGSFYYRVDFKAVVAAKLYMSAFGLLDVVSELTTAEEPTSEETVYTYTSTEISGGVNESLSICYELTEKGGWHECDKSAELRDDNPSFAYGNLAQPWICGRFEFDDCSGYLHGIVRKFLQSSARSLQVWNSGCNGTRREFHHADILSTQADRYSCDHGYKGEVQGRGHLATLGILQGGSSILIARKGVAA